MSLLLASLDWLVAIRRRLALLALFAAAFLLAALSARLLAGDGSGHADLDRIFEIGGPTLASAYLLAGWAIGRFPLLAALVLVSGVFSDERSSGLARLHLTRPVPPAALYGSRIGLLLLVAFAASALLMPAFDLILLGHAQPGTWTIALGWIVAYGCLVAALSVWTRADAWIALFIAIVATAWHSLRVGGVLDVVPAGARQFLSFVLPPHGALLALESAFASARPVPWTALLTACLYGLIALLIGWLTMGRREI